MCAGVWAADTVHTDPSGEAIHGSGAASSGCARWSSSRSWSMRAAAASGRRSPELSINCASSRSAESKNATR